jgi:lipopolysaccharide transport system ATP-binding protein
MSIGKLVIRAEGIAKSYRLGITGAGSFKKDLQDWWHGFFSSRKKDSDQQDDEAFWALKDISFDIREGEVVGFIGKNGSGKSTLLKLISRIYPPTEGTITGRGKVVSLLEVGTGFHEELTGRENIYLNGEILGMTTSQINDCYEDIVAFSGVEKFIDTPVKRYSSGMYVRLAFSVAAHIDPDILIIDEVLAVGDAGFQEKCLAKIQEIASKGDKTIIFVSHDMNTVRRLCNRVMYLSEGRIIADGSPDAVIQKYLKEEQIDYFLQEYGTPEQAPGNDRIRIKKAQIVPPAEAPGKESSFFIQASFWLMQPATRLSLTILVYNFMGDCILNLDSETSGFQTGLVEARSMLPSDFLNPSSYYVTLIFSDGAEQLFEFPVCLSFDVAGQSESFSKAKGMVNPGFPLLLKQTQTA